MRLKIVLVGVDSANRILDSPIYDLRVEKVYGSGVFTQMFEDEPFNFDAPVLEQMYFFNPDFIFENDGEFFSIYRFWAHINDIKEPLLCV